MQIKVKEYTKENLLEEKLKELETTLLETQKELQRESEYNNHLEGIIKENTANKSTTITIKSATKIEFVQVKDIICCNADNSYTDIQLQDGRIITAAKPLSSFEKMLQQYTFFRISKSYLINTEHIRSFNKSSNQILLQGNILLDISRRRRVEFLKTL